MDRLHREELMGMAIGAGKDRIVRLRLMALGTRKPNMPTRVDREIVIEAAVSEADGVVTQLTGRGVALELVIRITCPEVILEMAIHAAIGDSGVIEVRAPPLRRIAVTEFTGRRIAFKLVVWIAGAEVVLEVTLRTLGADPGMIKFRRTPITGRVAIFARLRVAFE
jgi:hypothetical protein